MRLLVEPPGRTSPPQGDLTLDLTNGSAVALLRAEAPMFAAAFADWIGNLNRANAGPRWWTLTLPGKIPLTLPLPSRALALRLIDARSAAMPARVELRVVTDDAALTRQLEAWARERGHEFHAQAMPGPGLKEALNRLTPLGPLAGAARLAWSRLWAGGSATRATEPGKPVAAFFTLAGPNSVDDAGRYQDLFFGPLIDEARRRGYAPLIWAAVPKRARQTLRRLKSARGPDPILPLDAWLPWTALAGTAARALRARRNGLRWTGNPRLDGIDLTVLIEEELAADARSSRLVSDLWYETCAEAFFMRVKPSVLFYPFENLARERAILGAARRLSPGTRLIGCQHAALTLSHLNYKLGRGEEEVLPLPDKIVCMGAQSRDFLRDWGGFPDRLLAVGCALRQTPPPASAPAPRADGRFRLLLASATSMSELTDMLRTLEQAYGENAPDWLDVVIRPHPLFALKTALALTGPLKVRFRDGSGEPLAEQLAWADAVAYASSTVAAEALAFGRPVIGLDQGHWFGIDPLEGFTDFRWTARTGRELRARVADIRALPAAERAERAERARAWAGRFLPAPTPAGLESYFS
ncbi:MAG TPA: hypothetical protein DCZ01_05105 [Elusimicrobia bacterium]|nr:MAG: hypothetical protein A2X40_02935 [Elusimicrobia bacterium GWC2_65_9]OHC66042.1 MAG: hypothetical protein A2040_03605 [Rhodocyclales bacterium GWA2_65_19]HAZ07902.1 hypothetical protein [Elusimicrobiota bacterium]